MKIRKWIMVAMMTVISFTLLPGCGQKKEQEKEEGHASGRYVEKNIDMPEAVKEGKEIVFEMLMNPEGFIEIFGAEFGEGTDSSTFKIFQYVLDKGEWIKKSPQWIQKDGNITELLYGEDGSLYFMAIEQTEKSSNWKLYQVQEDGTPEEVVIKDAINQLDEYYTNMPFNIKVLKDNRILITYSEKCVLYENGDKVFEMENGGRDLAVYNNKVLLNNNVNTGSVLYDLEKKEKVREVPFNSSVERAVYDVDAEGTWYMGINSGIQRLSQNGTVWENIADGSLNSMGSPSYSINAITKSAENDFYVMLEGQNGKRELRYYYYDKDIAAVPSKTLRVVSLEESNLVRQAITQFQNENQDVKVDYKVLTQEGITTSDGVKLLNTELLAGKGADVLILDGLPTRDYIEKGILMELGAVIKPLTEKGELLPNILESSKINDLTYMVPAQIGIPILYGNKKGVEAGEKSLSDFTKFVSTLDTPVFGGKVYGNKDLLGDLTLYYGSEFIDNTKEINKEDLAKFLEDAKNISVQTQTEKGSILTEEMRNYSLMFSSMIADGYGECGITELKSLVDLYAPLEAIKRIKGSYTGIGSLYIPHTMAGINNNAGEKELASAFITMMLSEEIGKSCNEGGLPINQKALEYFITLPDDFLMTVDDFSATRPEDKKIEEFVQLCKEVNVMSQADSFLLEMIKNEADSCFSNEKTAEESAGQFSEKTKAYRAEQN